MSKKNKIIVICVIIFLIIALLVSLIVVDSLKSKQEQLAVNQSKVQIFYEIGDEFNTNSIDVYYEDKSGHVEKIEDFVLDASQFNSSQEGEYEIKISYKNISYKFNVFVYDKQSFSEIFYKGMIDNINSILVKDSGNTLYLNEKDGYIEYKDASAEINNQIFYTGNIYRIYDKLNNEYIINKKMNISQFFEEITNQTNYNDNLNLAQNYTKLYYDAIFNDYNYNYSFEDGNYYFTNEKTDNIVKFDNFGYFINISNHDSSFSFVKNSYFEFPNLPIDE